MMHIKTLRQTQSQLKWILTGAVLALILALYLPVFADDAQFGQQINPRPQCTDGIDNDSDGFTDYPDDSNCEDTTDDTEQPPECSDGKDNDSDSLIDYPDDDDCDNSTDGTEHKAPASSDGDSELVQSSGADSNQTSNPNTDTATGDKASEEKSDGNEPSPHSEGPSQLIEQVAQGTPDKMVELLANKALVITAGSSLALLLLGRHTLSFEHRCLNCKDRRYSMHASGLHRITCICCRNRHYPHRQTSKRKRR